MTIFDSVILGAVQGLTEFLPISSTGHLIIVREILGLKGPMDLSFDAVLQLSTAVAVIFYFWSDIKILLKSFFDWMRGRFVPDKDKTLIIAIILGTIPAVVFGLFLENIMENQFRSSVLVAVTLILGGALMWIAEEVSKQDGRLTARKGFWIGIFQSLALIPGISRSGAVISGGLFLGLDRLSATKFAFLLSVPIILGSGSKKLIEIGEAGAFDWQILFGSITSLVFGLLAIHYLIRFVKRHSLNWFVLYRIILAILIFIFL